jgi:hypothetical protein
MIDSSLNTGPAMGNADAQANMEILCRILFPVRLTLDRVRQLRDVADEYLADYRLRFRGVTFAEYAIGHMVRILGDDLLVDIDESTVLEFQTNRLKQAASPKSINEEIRYLLTIIGELP